MSLDGFIADDQGGYDWIRPVAGSVPDTRHQLPFHDFLADVDVVVMGRRCYDQGQHRDFVELGKRVIVATALPRRPEEGVTFIGAEVVDVVTTARAGGRHCFLFGGGVLVQSFLAADAVDLLTIGVVPVILGSGRPLFPGKGPALELRLTDYTVQDGKIRLVYERRQAG